MVVLIAVIAVLWYALDTMITLGVGTPRFYNVYVNEMCIRDRPRASCMASSESSKTAA